MDEDKIQSNERKLRLADAGNTHNYALEIIRSKGYSIYLYPDEREEFYGNLWAIKDKHDFIATNPLSLLGLIALWEHFGDEWRAQSVPNIEDEIADITFPEDDYSALSNEDFAHIVEYLRPYFEAIWKPLLSDISRTELAHIMNTYYLRVRKLTTSRS